MNIVELQGTTGSAPANDRKKGFADAIAANPNLKVIASQTGDFTRAGGKAVMEQFLKANPKIDVLFAHNDDMGLGALEAITAAGKVPGKDIKIITIDAVKDGMQALADGKFNFIAECSPLLGPQLMDLVKKVHAGETVPDADRDRGGHLHARSRPRRPCPPASTDPAGRGPSRSQGRFAGRLATSTGSVPLKGVVLAHPSARTTPPPILPPRGRSATMSAPPPILTMSGISKSFPGVQRARAASTSGCSPARCTR